jgi:hypothetical protein
VHFIFSSYTIGVGISKLWGQGGKGKKKKKSGDYLANCFRCRIISWGAVCVCAIACFGFFPLSHSRNKGRTTQTAVWNLRWSEWSGSTWSSSSWLSQLWLFNPLRLYSGCKLIDFWYFLYSTWSNAREQLLCSLSPIFVVFHLRRLSTLLPFRLLFL